MAKNGRSFFERLTGNANIDDYDEVEILDEDEYRENDPGERKEIQKPAPEVPDEDWVEEEVGEGQLTVDVYNTPNEIIIKAIVAGVRPDQLDISITRDMVTIRGRREEEKEVTEEDYFYRELYWGSFARTILLPQEIEVEQATASEKHGMLVITLPKIDKEKQTRLKVKSG